MNVDLSRSAAGAVALAVLMAAGCGGRLPPTTDLSQGREMMTAALDTWKSGKAAETLGEHTPPIDFRDTNWEKGDKLSKYTIEKEQQFGPSAKFTVKLQLTDKSGGGARSRTVTYSVDTGSTIVIRPEF